MYAYKIAEILGNLDFGESNEEDRDRTYGHNSKSVFYQNIVCMHHMHMCTHEKSKINLITWSSVDLQETIASKSKEFTCTFYHRARLHGRETWNKILNFLLPSMPIRVCVYKL